MSENELEFNKIEQNKKGKIKFILCGILIVAAITIGLYFGYKKLGNDPVGIYKDAINASYKSLNNYLKEAKKNSMSIDLANDPIQIDLEANLESNMDELKNFTNINYYLGLGLDYKSKQMNLELGLEKQNETIIDALIAVFEEKIYLKSTELFSKVIEIEPTENIFENMSFDFTVNNNKAEFNLDNYEIILKEMKTIIIDSLDKDKMQTKNTTTNIQNKEYKVKRVSYLLDQDNMERTIKFISDGILDNNKLMDALSASLGLTKTELKDALSETPDMSTYNDIELVLYTDKLNNIIGGEMLVDEEKIISFDSLNDEINFVMEVEGETITISKDKSDLINIKANDGTTDILDILIEIKKNKDTKVDYRLDIEGTTYSGTIEETNIKRTENSVTGDIKFSLNTSVLGNPIRLYLSGNYSLKKKNITTIDPTNSVKINDMTEAEAMELLENLNKVLGKLGLQDLLGSMM